MKLKKTFFFSVILLLVIVAVGLFIFFQKYSSKFNENLSGCKKLKTGNINLEIRYPEMFITKVFNINPDMHTGSFDLYKKGEDEIVLSVDLSTFYESLESILENSLTGLGPRYEKSIFNGNEAAFYKFDSGLEKVGVWYYYKIPFGNRVILIGYHPSILIERERDLAEKMLQSITLTEVDENIAGARVEECSN